MKNITIFVSLLCLSFIAPLHTESYCTKGSGCSYYDSWEVKALTLQNRIDRHSPLRLAVLPHTHNSYNNDGDGYWADLNHYASLTTQLKMGIRTIELDTQTYPTGSGYSDWFHSIRLCHKICSWSDLKLDTGLSKVRDFLNTNAYKNEVLVIQLEINLPSSGKSDYLSDIRSKIESKLGSFIYRPSGNTCTSFNGSNLKEVTKAQILAAGKNIILTSSRACEQSKLQSWVFNNSLSNVSHKSIKGYPTCTIGSKSISDIKNKFLRSYNDGTNLGGIFDDAEEMTTAQVEALASCGVNGIGPERLKTWMSQHKAQVWSWGSNEPNNAGGNEDCAVQRDDGRFNDVKCSGTRVFACRRDTNRHQWKLSVSAGNWDQGEATCLDEFGSNYIFGVPHNGYQNNLLKDVRNAEGVSSVWVNYSDVAKEGDWVPGVE